VSPLCREGTVQNTLLIDRHSTQSTKGAGWATRLWKLTQPHQHISKVSYTMSGSGIKTVFGGASVGYGVFKTKEECHDVFKILKAHGVETVDTAQLYGDSEKILGEAKVGDQFIVDTKTPGGFKSEPDSSDTIVKNGHESKKILGPIDVFYIHAPSKNEPNGDVLSAINELYKAGVFKRFGLSNFRASDVQAVYDYCEKNSFVKPTVYQGNYSPVARRQDTELLPTLRKLGISFYAYSPLAGGFLTKTKQDIADGKGRFSKEGIGALYSGMYAKPELLDSLTEWEKIASEADVSRAELAYRWVKYNSALKPEHGDGVIVGCSSTKQLKQTLEGLDRGPLPAQVVEKIDAMWETIKHVAPLDNYADGVGKAN
jgi:aflatoxin B1 aldehyde reductase